MKLKGTSLTTTEIIFPNSCHKVLIIFPKVFFKGMINNNYPVPPLPYFVTERLIKIVAGVLSITQDKNV